MSCVLWVLCLLLCVAFNPCIQAESLYSVNEVKHSSCSDTLFSRGPTNLNVERGVQGAPCVGYMNFDTEDVAPAVRRVCGDDNVYPTKAMAQRFCYTLGLNMWRESASNSNNNGQIMLYDCDIYSDEGVDFPIVGGTILVASVEGEPTTGTLCLNTAASDDFCMDDCYDNAIYRDNKDNDCAGNDRNPYWATTCSDIDECHSGVLADCTGPFPESCMKRKACGDNTTCENKIGGWECKCNYGYRAVNDDDEEDPYDDGCEDIDECKEDEEDEDGEGICGYHAQCINKPGYYICVCLRPELYDEEEHKCKKSTCPALPAIPHATPRTSPPTTPEYGEKMVYDCYRGYELHDYKVVPAEMYSYYGYLSHTSFEVKCDYSGYWKPYPLPICVPIKCKPPVYVLYAHVSGTNWYYDEKITYTCENGFRTADYSGYRNYFERTCQEDGSWSGGTTCEDIDECEELPSICGPTAKYCINTIGSYLCSCVPWHNEDPASDYCDDLQYGGQKTRCELMKSLGLCENGECQEGKYGEAYCECAPGYEGSTCDRRVDSAALVIAIVALVLVIIVMCLCFFCCCLRQQCCGQQLHNDGGPVKVEPAYGVYGARPPGLAPVRYVRKGIY